MDSRTTAGKIDLHSHTTASDGAFSPTELVQKAAVAGIGTLAITDHDTVAGLAEAREAADKVGLHLVAGVELGSTVKGQEVHMLGYMFDPFDPVLLAKLDDLRDGRVSRGKLMVDKLNAVGLGVTWERVREIAGGGSVGRPHVAQALVEQHCAGDVDEAFEKYLAPGMPGYVPRTQISPEECVALVHAAGGASVLAHPAWLRYDNSLLPRLLAAGLDGLETYYGMYEPDMVAWLEALAHRHNLVTTGGSDFHGVGGLSHAGLGSVSVPPDCLQELERRAATWGHP